MTAEEWASEMRAELRSRTHLSEPHWAELVLRRLGGPAHAEVMARGEGVSGDAEALSQASNECSFSRLKLVESYLRTTMTEHRLDDIMIITCESDIADKLELDELARSWSLLKARRIQV